MEKKKLHRVVGILILTAVVIIILPLVTGKNGVPESKTLSMEVPAGSRAVKLADTSSVPQATAVPEPQGASSALAAVPDSDDQPPAVNPPAAAAEEPATPVPAEAVPPTPPAAMPPAQTPTPGAGSGSGDVSAPAPSADTAPPAAASAPASAPAAAPASAPDANSAAAKKPAALSAVVASAWAVQMGHFHNHTNAVRLANRLRNAGFNAFTRQVVSRNGVVSTRVYVGPESAQASARRVSTDIHAQTKLQGMVVPFEALAL